MKKHKLIACLYLKEKKAVKSFEDSTVISKEPAILAKHFSDKGADEILIFDLSKDEKEHEEAIALMKEITKAAEVPVSAGGNIKRLEDVKKILYAGCDRAMLNLQKPSNVELLVEVSKRFGKEKIAASIEANDFTEIREPMKDMLSNLIVFEREDSFLLDQHYDIPITLWKNRLTEDTLLNSFRKEDALGVTGDLLSHPDTDFMELKRICKKAGYFMNTWESKISWSDFKLNKDGHIPVIVQDYKTEEVLMLAYMNEEAFQQTMETGKMTYYSRSRQELWVKGLTSGHIQYVKSLTLDCDNDTILAKVSQVGVACHTGNRSCFFQPLVEKEYDKTNPLKVFEEVYSVILDRKNQPKEGSYTNYLFDKGIDKILKKVGEEATEIVIAAKNPDAEEIKYEVSDFLYHLMVLMVERGVTWEDITKELARR